MEKRPVVPVNCFFKGSYNPVYEEMIAKCKDMCYRYNNLHPNDVAAQREFLRKMFKKTGKDPTVVPPFWCDYGYNIEVGDYFYANHNFIVQDGVSVKFGDNVFIAPNCLVTTAEHAVDPQLRKEGVEIAKPVTVGNNVWIGAGSILLAGVSIGDNSVIGAGSVVTKDIPANVVAVGVPCKVLRQITEEDKHAYPFYGQKD